MPLTLYRRGRIWHIRGSVAGRSLRESTGLSDKRKADIYRARRENELINERALGKAATRTFAQAANIYMEAGGEGRFLGPLLLHFGRDKLVNEIDQDAVNRAAAEILPNAATATINRQIITPVSAVVSMHYKSLGLRPPVFPKRPERNARLRWLTPEEAEALLKACDPRASRIVGFLLGSGCRTSEAFRLRAKDVHLSTAQVFIGETKNNDSRMVRLPRRSIHLLGHVAEEGPVFTTPKGLAYKTGDKRGGQMKTAFDTARIAAGLEPDVTPHVLRHTWATWYYAQTKDFGGLMDLGGWRTAVMANRYRKIAPEDLGHRLYKYGWDFTDTKWTQETSDEAVSERFRVIK